MTSGTDENTFTLAILQIAPDQPGKTLWFLALRRIRQRYGRTGSVL